jgi:hypothetical protein
LVNPASPITPAFGQRAIVEDTGGFGVTFDLPLMTASEALGGKRCSLVLPLGNPNQSVTVNASAGQAFADPLTGASVSSVTYPSGTFTSYTDLTWEAAPGAIPALPATILPPLVPDNYAGPLPNPAIVPVTINGTGGTLPSLFNTVVEFGLAGSFGPPVTVNSATQPGGPGTAWTIQADIPAGFFPAFGIGLIFDVRVTDASTGGTFALLNTAFGIFTAPTPAQPATDLWVFDEGAPGAGSAGRLDETLAAGPNTNGQSAYVSLEDQVVWTEAVPPLADPTVPPTGGGPGGSPNFHPKASRSGPVGPGAGYVDVGSAIHTFTGFTAGGPGNTIWMRAVMQVKTAGPTGGVGLAVLEEIWSYDFGTWSRVETLVSSLNASLIRFNGTGASIFVQGRQDPTLTLAVRGVIEWSWINGFPPS